MNNQKSNHHKIEREVKIMLLTALKNGYFTYDDLVLISKTYGLNKPPRTLTKEEARELWANFDKQY